jgi:enterochelin esterase family protein
MIDHDRATFTWQGPASHVGVVGDWCDWIPERALPLRRVGPEWTGHLTLPGDAYVEYAFLVDGVKVPDPTNPKRIANGIGGVNSQLWMPAAPRRALTLHRRRVPRGAVVRDHVTLGWTSAAPHRRRLDLYLPAGDPDPARLPLLVVLDGPDYLRRGRLDRTLDALIHDRAMAPVAVAFVANAGRSRGVEYAASDFTLRSLTDAVVPAAVERLGLGPQAGPRDSPGRATILGSSMGGLMALHAAVRRPDLFGQAIVQSCGALDEFDLTLIDVIRLAPPAPIRIWQDAGDFEWLAAANDHLAALLRERGYDVTYRRGPHGHNQVSWNELLVDALPRMFPPEPAVRRNR